MERLIRMNFPRSQLTNLVVERIRRTPPRARAHAQMSAAVVRDFFPGLERFLGDTLWTFLFPTSVEQLCLRPQLSLQISEKRTFALMWPAASICCLVGFLVGFSYGVCLLFKSFASKARNGTFVWGCAFLWYGMMSLGGLFYHCISQTRVFYVLDLISTACACVSLLAMYGVLLISDDRSTKFRSSLLVSYGLLICLSILGGDVMRNFLYLGPASLAFVIGAYFVMVRASKDIKGWLALACASLSAVVAVASVPLDPWLCFVFGPNFSLLFWFFLGCDLAMVFLYHFTVSGSHLNDTIRHPPKYKLS